MSDPLAALLHEARSLGFLGPRPVDDHLRHAAAFARVPSVRAASFGVDLGSGGGIPGLVLACAFPASRWILLDANHRRTAFLRRAVSALELGDRVGVLTGRAENVAHDENHRSRYDLVVSRAFGPPAVVAECAAPFLTVEGHLVVSEPPEETARWSLDDLGTLGLAWDELYPGPPRLACMVQVEPCPRRFPRRVGVPSKRPLW